MPVSKFKILIATAFAGGLLVLEPAQAIRGKNINDPFAIGMKLMDERSYAEAAEMLQEAVKEDPSFVAAHIELARSLALSGKRKEGIKRLVQALSVAKAPEERASINQQRILLAEIFYTNSTFQQFQDGLNLLRDRKTRAAIQSFAKALAKEPDNAKILSAYGNALLTLDDRSQSVNLLERAHSILPEREDIRISLANGILDKQPKRAASLLKSIVEKEDAEESTVLAYVQALEREGKIRDAISVLRRTTDNHHDRLRSVFWLGKYYSLQPEGTWMARRYLMVFLRRTKSSESTNAAERDPEIDSLRRQATGLLKRINADLGVKTLDE